VSERFAVGIEGIGVWAPGVPDWAAAASALCGNVDIVPEPAARPAPSVLAPNERRRAPESVLLALEVAQQACAMSGRPASELPHVFASAYGDLAINDYLCATLARAAAEVSPIRFHNSVHNAPAGYWAIATGCQQSSTALSAGGATFGAALLEAALLAHVQARAVLLAAYDVAAVGPLRDVIDCSVPFGAAFVLAPPAGGAYARLDLELRAPAAALAPGSALLHALYAGNAAARALPLLQALARREPCRVDVAAGDDLDLVLEISF